MILAGIEHRMNMEGLHPEDSYYKYRTAIYEKQTANNKKRVRHLKETISLLRRRYSENAEEAK